MKGQVSAEHVGIEAIAANFPRLPDRAIERPHILDTLEQLVSSDVSAIFLEGEAGIGATTLLAQFALTRPSQTFCLFVKPASRFAYSVDYLRLVLAEQYYWYVHGVRLQQDVVDVSEFEALQLAVRRKARGGPLFILIDGLNQIPLEDERFIAQIFREVLPLGVDTFRFVITGATEVFGRHVGSMRTKSFQLMKFSEHESDQMLIEVPLLPEEASQLKKLCKGIPGRLASIVRLMNGGVSPQSILDSDPDKYLAFIGLEFKPIEAFSMPQRMLIAVLTFSRHSMSRHELLEVCPEATSQDVSEVLGKCTFLIERDSSLVEFMSEAHRRFAEKALMTLRQDALTRQVEHLIVNPNSPAAVRLLPTYYQLLNRQQKIVDLLSPEHYTTLLELTQSIGSLRTRAALGARSALELKQTTELFRFALQRSIFTAVSGIEGLQSEVSALVALGQTQKALEVASVPATKEARLALMAEYCRRVREKGRPLDAELVTYIKDIAAEIDFSELGDLSLSIAENLVFVDPDLALSIIDSAVKIEAEVGEKDVAIARLSIAASMSDISDRDEVNEKATSRISDQAMQRMMSSLNSIVSRFSYDEIVRIASEMQIDRRIYFLRRLVATSVRKPRVLDVVEFALDEMIANSSYVPKVRDLADLAVPLASCADERVEKISKRLESQLGLVAKGAPSKDLIQFQMRLAHAEVSFDAEGAASRIAEAYYDVASMGNVETRVSCYSVMLMSLAHMDQAGSLEASEGFREVIKEDLRAGLGVLLGNTASQYQSALIALRALSMASPSDALAIASRMNTAERRNRAHREIAKTILGGSYSAAAAASAEEAISRIDDNDHLDETIVSLADSAQISRGGVEWLPLVRAHIARLRSPKQICSASIALMKAQLTGGQTEAIEDLEMFQRAIDQVDSLFEQVDLRYELTTVVAHSQRAVAEDSYKCATELRMSTPFSSPSASQIIADCLNLILRAYKSLIRAGDWQESHQYRFEELCRLIPCSFTRSLLFSEMAIRAWCVGKGDVCTDIWSRNIRPLLDDAREAGNAFLYGSICEACFPAIYCAHRGTAYRILEDLSTSARVDAVYVVGRMILRKLPPSEPQSEVEDERARVTKEDLIDVIELLDKAPNDWVFYSILEFASRSIVHKDNKGKVSGQQKQDFVQKAMTLASARLPDPNNIQHPGYLLLAKAQGLRVLEARSDEWARLVADARMIDNVADRAFVMLEIAKAMPTKMLHDARRLIHDARQLINEIPSSSDRYDRLETYIRIARKLSPAEARTALGEALALTFETPQRDMASRWRRNLVDLAELVQPGLEDRLAEMIDDDPARAEAKAELIRGVEVQKLKRKMSASGDVDPASLTHKALPSAAWRNVASLSSGRLEPLAPDQMVQYLDAAGRFDLHQAFPVLAWYLENSSKRYVSGIDVHERVLPLAEVMLLTTELAASVIGQSARRKNAATSDASSVENTDENYVIRPGDRQGAMTFLRAWLRANACDKVIFCDPYFRPRDVDFLRAVLAECPGATVEIITSMKVANEGAFDTGSFVREWQEIIDQDPPVTEVLAVGAYATNEILVHDRWLLANGKGLRLGTSFGTLGGEKLSEISSLDIEEAASVFDELSKYLRKERVVNGSRVGYSSVSL